MGFALCNTFALPNAFTDVPDIPAPKRTPRFYQPAPRLAPIPTKSRGVFAPPQPRKTTRA